MNYNLEITENFPREDQSSRNRLNLSSQIYPLSVYTRRLYIFKVYREFNKEEIFTESPLKKDKSRV